MALRRQLWRESPGNRAGPGVFARTVLALLPVFLVACSSVPAISPRIAIDRSRLSRSRYVEFVYAEQRLSAIDYRKNIIHRNAPAPHLQCKPSSTISRVNPVLGAWVWRSDVLLHNRNTAHRFLHEAAAHGIRNLYLQIHPDLESFAGLLNMAKGFDIKVFALTGSPDDVDDYGPALRIIDQVLAYNQSHATRFSGIQFDVEPYLLKRYSTDKHGVLERYAGLLRALHARTLGKIPFGVVVPFWFDQETVGHRNLMGIVSRNADNLAIMSYRTRIGQLLAVSNNGLCYAQMYGKPAMLGIELRHIPSETHYFIAVSQLSRYIRVSGGHSYLPKDPRQFTHYARSYTVNGSAISFYPHVGAAFRYTRSSIQYRSFSGWIMDGLGQAWIR